jgi:polyphosphate:AMP phosphotransferase
MRSEGEISMFETVELGQKIDKAHYEREISRLRVDLINAQYDLRTADFPVIIVLTGDDRLACTNVLNGMREWMDARYLQIHALGRPTVEQIKHPFFWRYWRRLPRKGRIGVFMGDWVSRAIVNSLQNGIDKATLARHIAQIRRFEQTLVDDGALLIKYWFHLPRKEHKKRLKQKKKGSRKSWRIRTEDKLIYDKYDVVLQAGEHIIRETSSAQTTWTLVEATDRHHSDLSTAQTLLKGMRERLFTPKPEAEVNVAAHSVAVREQSQSVLDTVDLSRAVPWEIYRKELDRHQAKLNRLSHKAARKGLASVLVFEGWDAAGKGGIIRRITTAMDARDYNIIPIAAPTQEENAYHYLWRFWNRIPRDGRTTIFDRSWYGRVLVERVEGFATEAQWQRAYAEINEFETLLREHGILLLKFWIHIDADEQLRRFQAREDTPYKQYKITEEDYRNREKWDEYVQAVDEMVAHTSTDGAPWHLIAANDKRFARLEVIKTYCKALEKRL